MKTPFTKQLSIAGAIAFAAWVVWLWVDPLKPETEKKNAAKMLQQIVQHKPAPQPTSQPQTYVLPAPPQPLKPIVQPVTKVEPEKTVMKEVKPQPKPVVKAKPKAIPKKVVVKENQKPETKTKSIKTVKQTPKSKPEPEVKIHEVTKTEAVGGRALLRVLEHGKGPQIEIAWPSNASVRDGLYQKFQNCYGMENAMMDTSGNLFRTGDPSGQRWEINLDRFSGFLRQASGRLPRAEQREMRSIEKRHGYLDDPVPVRVFPRRVDASLLGGLKAVVGDQYMNARTIQAQYTADGIIEDIRVDGRSVTGMIKLSQFRNCRERV